MVNGWVRSTFGHAVEKPTPLTNLGTKYYFAYMINFG